MTSAALWAVSVILMRVSGLQIPAVPLTFFKNCVAVVCLALLLVALGEDWMYDIDAGGRSSGIAVVIGHDQLEFQGFAEHDQRGFEACRAVAEIGDGHLTPKIALSSKDELGQLAMSFQGMGRSLDKSRQLCLCAKCCSLFS